MVNITLDELEKRLEGRIVCDVLNEVHTNAQRWNKGGALIHKVRAAGYIAETGARHIAEGATPITEVTSFKEMKIKDKQMYDGTLKFLHPLVQSEIYVP